MAIQVRPSGFQISIVISILLPAVILNPVLFLHGLNSILSWILPPIAVPDTSAQPLSYPILGPSAEHPHIDIHSSDNVCWTYTLIMVAAQMFAFYKFKLPELKTGHEEEEEQLPEVPEVTETPKQESKPERYQKMQSSLRTMRALSIDSATWGTYLKHTRRGSDVSIESTD